MRGRKRGLAAVLARFGLTFAPFAPSSGVPPTQRTGSWTAHRCSQGGRSLWSFTTYETNFIPYVILGGMTLVILVFIMVLLKRRDQV